MKRLIIQHLDKWVPAFLSILSLLLVAGLSWQYDRQLAVIRLSKEMEIRRLDKELDQIRADNREREARLRAEIVKISESHEIETMRSQTLRERLIKKGWIE